MKIKALMLVGMLLSLALVVQAQTSKGTVSGIVTDAAGAVVAGATVTLHNTETGLDNTATTNDSGFYRFDAVDLGSYSLTIASSGFGTVTKTGLVVNANQTAAIDAQLAPGGQQVTVDVVSESGAMLQTEAPLRGGNITTQQVTELPIASRNPALLALTLPGVSSNRFGFGIGTFSVNGARGRSNNFLLDGIENNDISVAGQGFQVTNPDAVAEVSVLTSNFDAEFGRAGGGVINTITKSGTNDFHGTLSAFLDSTRDDAITLSQSRNPVIIARGRMLPGTQQIYAGTLGGPLYLPRFGEGGPSYYNGKNRTFFFTSYQEERQNSAQNVGLVVPTAAGLALLNTAVPTGTSANLDLYRTVTQGAVGNASPFNVAIGARPGCPAPCNIQMGTFNRSLPFSFKDRQFILRIDHELGVNDRLSGRYVNGNNAFPSAGPTFEGFDSSQTNKTQNLVLQEAHVFGATLTNDLRLGYSRIAFDFPIAGSSLAEQLPLFNITNLTSVGVASNLPQGRTANNYILQDTMTYVRGDHTFRFGTELLQQRSKQFAPFRGRGELSFGNSAVAGSPSFSGFANFIDNFGGAGSALRDFGSPAYYPEMFRQSYFVQDRWRASESLTLTLGLRYENFGQPVNSVNTAAFTGLFNVDPATRLGPYALPNDADTDNNNFAPTLGFAYSPSFQGGLGGFLFGEKRTVLRGGYQITYDSFFNNIASNAASSSPNIIGTTTTSTATTAQPRGLANLTASFPLVPRPLSPLDAQTLVTQDLVSPYYQRWSLGLQRELPGNLLVEMSYVGTKGTKLYANEDLNPTVPLGQRLGTPTSYPNCTPATNVTALQATTQFPAGTLCPLSGRLDNLQGSRLIRTNGGSSIYHAAQFNATRRFSKGLTFTSAYTWSKFIDNASEVFGVANTNLPQQASRPPALGFSERLERSVSLFDRTHRAVFTYVYQLPFYKDQRGFLGHVLGGWETSGVTTIESGVPLTVINGQDADSVGGNFDRPDYNPNGTPGLRAVPAFTTPSTADPLVAATNPCSLTSVGTLFYTNPDPTTSCIGLTPGNAQFIGILAGSGRTGNLGRNTLRTPRTTVFDMNFTKRVRLTEGTRIEFRTEVFNIFNHPTPLLANPSPFTPASGSIPASVFGSVAGRFLDPRAVGTDSGGRLIRYQLKFLF